MHPNVKALLEIEFAAQKSEEWLALRGNMLTASDAATALGVNSMKLLMVCIEKCGRGVPSSYSAQTRELYEMRLDTL